MRLTAIIGVAILAGAQVVLANPLPPLGHSPVVPLKGWNGTDNHHPHPTGHHPHPTGHHPHPTGKHPHPTSGIHHTPKHKDHKHKDNNKEHDKKPHKQPHNDEKLVTITSIVDEDGHVIAEEEVVNKKFVWGGPGDPPPSAGEGFWLSLHEFSEDESSVNKRFIWEVPGDPPPPAGEGLPFQLHEFTEASSKRDTWDDAIQEGGSLDKRHIKNPPEPPPHNRKGFWPLHGGLSKRFTRRVVREEKMEKRSQVAKRGDPVSLGEEAEQEVEKRRKMGMTELDEDDVRRRKLGMKPKARAVT